MATYSGLSLPMRITLRALLNILLVWALNAYLSQYFLVQGGVPAYVIIGSLVTLMNIFVRPVLDMITLPLKLFATILAVIVVNGAFIQFTVMIAQRMDPSVVRLDISGGLWGWVVVAVVFGVTNWLIKEVLSIKSSE